jgi:hypothetical protein
MRVLRNLRVLAVALGFGCSQRAVVNRVGSSVTGATAPGEKWVRFTDFKQRFHLDYPASWKVNVDGVERSHYTVVFAAFNSAGKDGLTVQEQKTGPNTWELNRDVIAGLIPLGTAYIDVSWIEGPAVVPGSGPAVDEMQAADITGLIEANPESLEGDLIDRDIHFWKWGKDWDVTVFMHAPATKSLRGDVEKILASFRLDGPPAAGNDWAIDLARGSLPAEADPEKYIGEGGSAKYQCKTAPYGNEAAVTFTKRPLNAPAENWYFLVKSTGEVIALKSDWAVDSR